MKHYVFISYIIGSGGVQCYIASKAKYLESVGWHVIVISGNNPKSNEKCSIDYLNKFLPYGNPLIDINPCQLPRFLVYRTLRKCLASIGPISDQDEIVVESWNCQTAIWAELIASRIHGRHFFWTANEYYRGGNTLYEEKIGFFEFKMDRGEIFTSLQVANRLFKDYRQYKTGDFIEVSITEDPVQDVEEPSVESLKKKDWNVCYIGRSMKAYVPNIYKGIELFAKKHPEKEIQFIIVGEVGETQRKLLPFHVPNLTIMELGDLYPLPRKLFSKTDVIIAGSGSARHSADEGALVITADAETKYSHGLLGYDTNESVYCDIEADSTISISFDEALEKALVKQTWRDTPNRWVGSATIKESVAVQTRIIENAEKKMEYYDERRLLEGRLDFKSLLRTVCSTLYWSLRTTIFGMK